MKFAIIFTVAIACTLGAEEVLYSLSDLMRGPLSKRTNNVKKVEEVKEVEQVKEVMVKPAKEVNPYVYRPFYPKDKSQRHNVGYYFEPLGVDQAAPQPQFVLMTFDDAVTRQLFTQVYQTLLNRVDVQTSCPIHATFFTSHKHTDYAAVQALDSWGHEIALHSYTHGDDSQTPEENVRTNFTARRSTLQHFTKSIMKFAIAVIFTVAIACTLGAEEVLYSLSDLMRGPLSKRTNNVKKVEEVKEVERVKEVMVKPAKEVNPYVYRPFYPKDKSQRHNVGYYFEPLGVDQAAPQPQFVLMTFDDAVTRQLFTQVYQTLLNRVDVQTSCPIHATFFTSHKHTDYAAVQALDSWGHEIALHSYTHGDDSQTPEENVRTNFTARRWAKEVQANAEMAMGFADLTGPFGFRAPFLHTGGNALFQILANSEFTMYDSSLTFPHSRKTWPYHLDNPRRQYYQGCSIKPCPTRRHNLWEVPLGLWKDINENDCQMMDGCNLGSTVEEALSVMMRNFNDYRRDNIPPYRGPNPGPHCLTANRFTVNRLGANLHLVHLLQFDLKFHRNGTLGDVAGFHVVDLLSGENISSLGAMQEVDTIPGVGHANSVIISFIIATCSWDGPKDGQNAQRRRVHPSTQQGCHFEFLALRENAAQGCHSPARTEKKLCRGGTNAVLNSKPGARTSK
eukprot:maker-scaffold37_size504123-snap-gene-2.13 protein:Tk07373 transcript:maker-scaffold37_size504123-snap-gene-2.13-mRNA-1 annotation:"flocculation protein flo11 isoform x2"